MAHLKAKGEYEAFKTKKAKEGMRRCHDMSKEQRNEVKRKNRILEMAWRNRMIQEKMICYLDFVVKFDCKHFWEWKG